MRCGEVVAETEYEVPTWNQIYDMLLNQAGKIRSDGYTPDIIVGIARGGLVPSRILADLLETRDFAIITIEYYFGIAQRQREPFLKQCLHTQLTGKKVLLVDDVSDGGRSLQLAKKHLEEQCAKEIKIATIYCKPGTVTTPDYFEKETSHWIVFPWEARETLTKIGRRVDDNRAMVQEVSNLVRAGFPKQLAEKLLSDGGQNP
jgi:hypoxanthine phosphoribosyltransferase